MNTQTNKTFECCDGSLPGPDGMCLYHAKQTAKELLDSLRRLRAESQHYLDNNIGGQFLQGAIDDAVDVIAKARGI